VQPSGERLYVLKVRARERQRRHERRSFSGVLFVVFVVVVVRA
jgi:hypothetical protein